MLERKNLTKGSKYDMLKLLINMGLANPSEQKDYTMSDKYHQNGPLSMPEEPKQFDAKGEKLLSDPGKSRPNCEDDSNVLDSIPVKEKGKME